MAGRWWFVGLALAGCAALPAGPYP